MGWPRQARASDERARQASLSGRQQWASKAVCALGKPSGMPGAWVAFLPHSRGEVERGGGARAPPMGELSINLVVNRVQNHFA